MSEPVARKPRFPMALLQRRRMRDRDAMIYGVLLILALAFPATVLYATGSSALISQAADAGTYVLLAIGLNVVVGFAGLLDLGYAAFFAIGAYTCASLASMTVGIPAASSRAASGASGVLGEPTAR